MRSKSSTYKKLNMIKKKKKKKKQRIKKQNCN